MADEPAVDLQGVEVGRRSARKDGREVVALRCVDTGVNGFVVECDVYPVNGIRVEPLRPGPYRFATRAQADGFMDEAAKALTYLGCEL
jgi:5-carboxymethyl-2-hydroxymuconate isomerase